MLLETWVCKYLFESLLSILLGIYPEVALQDPMANLCLIFGGTVTLFYSGCTILHSHQPCTTILVSPQPCLHLLVSVLDYSHPNECEGGWNFDRQRRDKPAFQATDAWRGYGMRWIQSHTV